MMEWTDFEDFTNKFDSSVNMDNFEKRYSLWSFYDGMGMLLKKDLVDREMIYYLFGIIWSYCEDNGILIFNDTEWSMFELA